MNSLHQARKAYSSVSAPIRTDRGTELDAFTQVTQRLRSLDPKRDFAQMIDALHANRRLWTLLAIDVADADNKLPQPLRAQIFYLAEFTDVHTSRILKGDASVDALIDVNTAVMRGLQLEAPGQ